MMGLLLLSVLCVRRREPTFGTTGFGYPVDAGLIGLVPYDMVSDKGHEKIPQYGFDENL